MKQASIVATLLWLLVLGANRAAALEDVTVSYSGPSVGFLVTELAR